ncbi:MAG: PASTA domain-containing protein [Bacteroidia bacterium]|jgi:beta-lactam-binding protein with PASTA domain|nr:PASTA domain-containing protein [Bacteroidia bacterium]
MEFFKALGTHVLAMLISVTLLVTGISLVLKSYTRHGDSLEVPDLKGVKIEDAIRLLEEQHLRYQIIDSLYFEDKPALSILEQNPVATSKVKEGRIIYLTINTNKAPLVTMPNIQDVSLRQAESILANAGLKVTSTIYKPDLAKDVVLDVLYMNSSIVAGRKIAKGTGLTLVLGDGLGGESTELPDLTGLTLDEANNLLNTSSLSLGSVVYLGAISDSASAVVVRQNPPYQADAKVSSGTPIDLFLTQQ